MAANTVGTMVIATAAPASNRNRSASRRRVAISGTYRFAGRRSAYTPRRVHTGRASPGGQAGGGHQATPGDALRASLSVEHPTLLRTYSRLFYVTLSECASGTPRSSRSTCSNRAGGQPYRLHRWELPDSHPQRFVGSVHDDLVLDERDVLRPASMPVRS